MAITAPYSAPTQEEFRVLLRRHKLKATRQRTAVHEAMRELIHASADMVKEKLESRDIHLSNASIYNILSQLADCHIYNRRLSGGGKMFFDVIPQRHVHLYDRENHRFRDIVDDELIALASSHLRHRRFRGYSIEDLDIQIVVRPTKKNKTI